MRSPTVLGDDTAADILGRAIGDFRAGLLNAEGLALAVAASLEVAGDESKTREELERVSGECDQAEGDYRRAAWRLKVALAALLKLREAVGGASVKIEHAAQRMASEAAPPNRKDMNGYEAEILERMREINEVVADTLLRNENDYDFRKCAPLVGVVDVEP